MIEQMCLIDTPLLVRLANTSDALHDTAGRAVKALFVQSVKLCITAQNLIEFRNAATRAVDINGLGYTPQQAKDRAAEFECLFFLLEENSLIYPAWKLLVEQANVVGKQVHDARLVAVCQAHSVHNVLTFNKNHFMRFVPYINDFAVIDPKTL